MGSEPEPALPRGLWCALGAGLLLRSWYFCDLARQSWYGHPLVDALTYDRLAVGMLSGGSSGAFFRPPLYPFLLATLYGVFGHRPGPVLYLQFLLGLASLIPAYFLTRRWFGGRAALVGAWVGALYPLRIFFEGELLDVTLFTFLFLWGTWVLWCAMERGGSAHFMLAGLLLGAATLTRPNLLIALPFLGAGAWQAFRGSPRLRLSQAALCACGVALAVLPVTLHNWRAERAFIPVAANGGVNFYLGNAPGATGLTPIPPGLRWEAVLQEAVRAGHSGLGEQERYWYARAREAMLQEPGRWVSLSLRKVALFFNAAESSNNKALRHFTDISFPVRHFGLWYGSLVCLAVVGCAAARGRGSVFFLWLLAGFALSVAVFFVTERYRLPLVPLLAGAAAAGALGLLGAARTGDRRRGAILGTLLLLTAGFVMPDWLGAGRERISAEFQMGQIHLMRREPERALAWLERARTADLQDPDVLNSIGAAYFQLRDYERADAAYREALALGAFSEVWFNRGLVAEMKGGGAGVGEAVRAYRRALEINPLEQRARANLEALLAERGRGTPPTPR